MINNNKILTVSYGTFSCTLEGFDDSFGTMKAIAEYFRDLAADDRYFGAEPPQPDAQMLARIAQREISRHVEAREDEGRIVLSAKDKAGATGTALAMRARSEAEAADDADLAEVSDDTPETPTRDVADAPAPAPAVEQDGLVAGSKVDEAEGAEDAIAAPFAEAADEEAIAETVDTQDVADLRALEEALEQAEDDADAEEQSTPVAAIAAEIDTQDSTIAEMDIVPSLPDSEVEAFFADSGKAVEFAPEDEDTTQAMETRSAASDSIAEKLKRIRAVVSQQAETDTTPDYSEDQHADAAPAAAALEDADDAVEAAQQSDVVADTLRDIEDALDADDEIETQAASDESEEDDVAAILSRLDDAEVAPAAELTAPQDSFDADEDTDDNILASLAGYNDDMPDDDDEAFEEDRAQEEATAAVLLGEDDDDNLFESGKADAEAAEAAPEAAKAPAPRTRVLKVKRATLEAAIKGGQLEEYDNGDEDEDDTASAPEHSYRKAPLAERSSLSAEAEDELARELAELEADMGEPQTPTQAEADDAAEQDATEASRAARSDMSAKADEDFSRLMAETTSHMDEPESATRRDAFTHLRAAVVAKKADEAVGGTKEEKEPDEAYRDDLASVVRPRRPVSGDGARTERPADQRAAPLRLVAEQRIDVDQSASAAPVRPRRVAAVVSKQQEEKLENADSFEDFASDMGANKLPDLLEAAAAYLAFVEGQQQFSRPQLMNKVRLVEKDNFTREDGLRSFGKLLREGKIEKLKGGRFQVSEQIGFKPDTRAAG